MRTTTLQRVPAKEDLQGRKWGKRKSEARVYYVVNRSLKLRVEKMDCTKILDRLYVGSCPRRNEDVEKLCKLGIQAVLNLQTDEDNLYRDIDWPSLEASYRSHGVEVRRVPVRDFDSEDLAAKLSECVGTLRQLLESGQTVYLHCTAGAGRSPTVAMAYLHWYCELSFDDAYRYVRSLRACSPMLDESTMPQPPKS